MTYSWPLPADIPVSQPFGSNPGGYNPVGGHTGTDLAAPLDTPVHAPADGVIQHSNYFYTETGADNPWWLTSWGGITVVLDCGEVAFVFAHLNSTDMVDGQRVRKGDVIGYTGNTGTIPGMGYHLHFEALPDGWNFQNGTYGRVNPALYCQDYSAVGGPVSAVAPNQRVTGPQGVRGRDAATTSANVVNTFAGDLILDFKGFVHGETVQGNDVWFVGFSSGAYFWSGGFESQSTDNLPDLTPAPTPAPAPSQEALGYQRVTGANGVNLRDTPNKNGSVVKTFDPDLILDFKGFVHGEDPYGSGNDVWFVGKYSNTYAWSGAFTDSGTHDLPDITPTDAPLPSAPVIEKYDFDLDFATLTREDGVVITIEKSPADIGNLQKGNPTAKHNVAVIHQFGTPGVDTFESTNNQFKNAGTFVSAYWSVSVRRVRQHVSLKDRAYAAGSVGNDYVNIETDPNQDPETIATVRALLAALHQKEGTDTLMLHKNIPGNSTNCGSLIDLTKYATAVSIPTPQPEPEPTPEPTNPSTETPGPDHAAEMAETMSLLKKVLEWLIKLLGIK